MLPSILHFLSAYCKSAYSSAPPIADGAVVTELRAEVDRLRGERAGFFEEIAGKDDRIRDLEDEVDHLRMRLGLAEVPL